LDVPWTGCGQVRNLDPGKRYQAMLLNLGDGEHNMLSIAEATLKHSTSSLYRINIICQT